MRMRRWRALTPSTLPGWWSGRGSNRKAGRSQRPHARYPQHILWSHLKNKFWIKAMYMIEIVEAEREDLSILTYFAWCMLFPFIQESGRLASFVQNTRRGVQLGKFVHKTQLHSQQTPIWKRMAFAMQHCMENYQILKNSANFRATAEKIWRSITYVFTFSHWIRWV